MKRTLTALVLGISLLFASGGVCYSQDYHKGAEAYKKGDYETAFREWSALAEQGDADAQNNLSAMYCKGQGVTQDFKEAVKWYRQSAEQGGADAQYALGGMYGNGQGVLKTSRNVSGASIIDLQPTS